MAKRDGTALQAVGRWLNILGPAVALVVIFLVFWLLIGSRFVSFENNLQNVLAQSAIVAMASLGMTFIIASGGIDLSTGSSVALCAVLTAVTLNIGGDNPDTMPLKTHPILLPALALVVAVVAGTLAGAVNGLLITGMRVVPFIVTLVTMMFYRAMAKQFAHETKVYPPDNWLMTQLDPPGFSSWTDLLLHPWRLFSVGIWAVIALAVLMAIVLNYTRFGRHVLAIGSNENTARLCGIGVKRHKIAVYALGGLFAGLAGLLQYARTVQGDPTAANGLELSVIAAVVIGGASLNGGRGSIFGTLVGALIMNVIQNGSSLAPIPKFLQEFFHTDSPWGMPTYAQEYLTAIIILLAVWLDNFRRGRE